MLSFRHAPGEQCHEIASVRAVLSFARLGRFACVLLMLVAPVLAASEDSKLSEVQRQQIIRAFLAERPSSIARFRTASRSPHRG